jgi:uncharacterized repeat protein (TIGR01451 family)
MKSRFKAAMARRGIFLVLAAAGLAASGGAQAAGTAAGTTISNKATLNFSVGGVCQPAIASSPTGSSNGTGANTDFLVDNKISHTVVTTDASAVSVIPGQTGVTLSFSVTNTGNATQDYALAIANLATAQTVFSAANLVTDNFDVSTGTCVVKVNGATQNFVASLAPDASIPVTITCNIPASQVNTDVSGLSLTATAAVAGSSGGTPMTQTTTADTAGVDVVFADAAGTDDAARDGKSSARSAFKVSSAVIAVTKTVAPLCDPLNGSTNPKNIPGAYVQYTVTISNGASGTSATLATVTDTLSGNVTFDPDFISGAGAGTNCAAGVSPASAAGAGFKVTTASRAGFSPKFFTTASDGDGATFSGGTITINFASLLPADASHVAGELKAGESLTLVYQVKIN